MLEIKILAIKPTQLIPVILLRKYSPGIFGSDNSQDWTDDDVEGISLTQPGDLNWELEELTESAVSELQLQVKRLD